MTGLDRSDLPSAEESPRRELGPPVPGEGEDGLYSQSWFPVCLSEELTAGSVVGADFLGGRVVAFRAAGGGEARVLSAYCVHLGADLSVGEVVGDRLRCRFHRWEYDGAGRCAVTGIGDPVPPGARLFRFPARERHGIVWAFNGERPTFDVPDLPYPQDELVFRHSVLDEAPFDPWLVTAQTLDLQHFGLQHEFTMVEDPKDAVSATDHSMGYPLRVSEPDGSRLDLRVDIHGTNIFWQTGTLDGRWFFWITALCPVRPGASRPVFVLGARREGGEEPPATEAFLDRAMKLMMGMFADDAPVLTTIRFRPGMLTRSDDTLARFLEYVRCYPRANPARDFLT
ncbi:Rieske 2Fe-2S domain-containing protein [Streptomyces uncialis]|uniref:Rieske 2Fe-2S domain-containing protein n=1 Tax=Streptomyces uncialis TaxID=1048205 RepID=UPI0038076DB1